MAQEIINIGPLPNDGQGDNLRTAFDKTNNNFSQIWSAGPVGSNVQIAGNTISTLRVNQDLALNPNGTGNIRLNNNTIPGANNTWFLGSATNRWRGIYTGNIDAGNISISNSLTVPGDAYIGGNLTVEGDTIQIGNIVTDTKTIQLANTALNPASANGSGITVGANDDIATFLYNSSTNSWVTNLDVTYANGQPISKLPGGTNTYVQFNDGNNFGGSAAFTFNKAANIVSVSALNLQGTNDIIQWDPVNQHIDVSNTLSVAGSLELIGYIPGDGSVIKTPGGSGTDITIEPAGNLLLSPDGGEVYILKTTPSTSTSSGALVLNGGIGLDGNVNASGNISADYFLGNGSQLTSITGANVTGNVNSATNLAAATSILAGDLTINPASVGKNAASTQTFTLTGLTTNHKVVITCGTALPYGLVIASAWASAADTLSITIHNMTGGAVDLGNTDINYFAWV